MLLTLFTPCLNDYLVQELPTCQLLDFGPGRIWDSTHKFSAKSVEGNGPFCKKSLILPYK